MFNLKRSFILLIILSIALSGLFYLKKVFAEWKADLNPPLITITVTCSDGDTPDAGNNYTCKSASATIRVEYSDQGPHESGLYNANYIITNDPTNGDHFFDPARNTFTRTFTAQNTTSQYNISATGTDDAGNISNNGVPTTFTFRFLYSVKGTVYIDTNGNGLFETASGEIAYNQASPTFNITITGYDYTATYPYTITKPTNGTYEITGLAADSFTVNNAAPLSYINTLPSPSAYNVTVGSGCTINGNPYNATCTAGDSIIDLNFGIKQSVPWFQGTGGDMRVDSSIGGGPGFNDPLPSGGDCGPGNNYPSMYASIYGTPTDFSGDPGVIFSGDTTVNPSFGGGQASVTNRNWVVGGVSASWPETFTPVRPGVIRTSYSYYKRTIEQNFPPSYPVPLSTTPTTCGAGGLSDCQLNANLASGVYITPLGTNLTLTGTGPTPTYTFPDNRNYLFLVDGDLTIAENIIVPVGSTATFSVSGNIIVDKNVGVPLASCNETNQNGCICDVRSQNQNNCNIEGFYSTDNSFIINNKAADLPYAGNVCGNATGAQKDLRLNIAGSIVVNAGLNQTPGTFKNYRDLCNGNAICPAFAIIERPDFILNAPDLIKHPNFVWQEIAP